MSRDYYAVLGVSGGVSPEQLQQAYRALARKNHPDVNSDPAAEERFKEINDAYHVLSDPETRALYDRYGPDFEQFSAAGRSGANGAGAPRRRAGPRGAAGRTARAAPGGGPDARGFEGIDIDLEDLLGGVFGRWGAGGPSGPIPGADQEAEVSVSVEEAYRGGKRHVTLAGPAGERGYNVTIPAGVTDGQRIRLAGQGGRGSGSGPSGDLYLRVRILPHPLFRLDGRDIHTEVRLAPWEAALGATVPVPTPGGEAKVKVPPGSSSGRRMRLSGRGMPNPRGKPGELYAEVRIMVPPSPNDRERELFAELASTSTFDARRWP